MSLPQDAEENIEPGTESWCHDSPSSLEQVREDVYRIPGSIPLKAQKGWHRESKRMVREAIDNAVRLPNYDLEAHRVAINPLTNSFPTLGSPGRRVGDWIYLRGATPRVVIDENDKVVLWWFPELLGRKTLDIFNDATNDFISYEMATHEGTKVLKPSAKSLFPLERS
ncbi:hypothetical protein FRC12_024855 [Ceratobasidium sp. 428]|nr:hypothetical protein FRC12_024855 [Ceratobasidium sp. 428]